MRPQNTMPASEEILKLGVPHLSSRYSVKGRQISSRQVETRLIDVDPVNPCFSRTLVMWSMRTGSGTQRGKVCSSAWMWSTASHSSFTIAEHWQGWCGLLIARTRPGAASIADTF